MNTFITQIEGFDGLDEGTALVFAHGEEPTLAWLKGWLVYTATGLMLTPYSALTIYGAARVYGGDESLIPLNAPFASQPSPGSKVVPADPSIAKVGVVIGQRAPELEALVTSRVYVRWEGDDHDTAMFVNELMPQYGRTNISALAKVMVGSAGSGSFANLAVMANLTHQQTHATQEMGKYAPTRDEEAAQKVLVSAFKRNLKKARGSR